MMSRFEPIIVDFFVLIIIDVNIIYMYIIFRVLPIVIVSCFALQLNKLR